MSKIFRGCVTLVAIALSGLCANECFARGGGGGGHGFGGGAFHSFGGAGGYHSFGGAGGYHSSYGGAHVGTFSSGARSFSGSGFNRGYAGNYAHSNYGNYFGGGYGYGRGGYGYGRGYGGWGWGWGGWGLGLGWGWPWYGSYGYGWGNPYDYGYSYPNDSYYYTYSPTDTTATYPSAPPQVPTATTSDTAPASEDQQQAAQEALQYYTDARTAFEQGDYRNALRMAGHAGIEAPGNAKVHELTSLALFALGNYPAAASEAHAAMAMGPIANWDDLYGYYNNVNTYTDQLRALEKTEGQNPKSAADHFLLGYQYLMTGARSAAQSEFAAAVKLTPKDQIAAHYLKQLQSNAPLTPPTPPQTAARPGSQTM